MPMSRPSRYRHLRAAVALGVLAASGAACGGEPTDPYPAGTNPPNVGAVCDDPVGDLSREASELGGTMSEPAGVDLIRAEARVIEPTDPDEPGRLTVTFTTAGTITDAPNPELRLGQGLVGQLESFELVASPGEAPGDPWVLRLVTFRADARGGLQEAPRVVLPVPITVEGSTISYEVPLRDLPPIATYVWLFGSSSTSEDGSDTVIDDCDDYRGAQR
jgi:hypothetical protein